MFDEILNWKLLPGSHPFPGPRGGTCIMEAAIVAAGLKYRPIGGVADLPSGFCPIIGEFLMGLNDELDHDNRQKLIQFVGLLYGTDGNIGKKVALLHRLKIRFNALNNYGAGLEIAKLVNAGGVPMDVVIGIINELIAVHPPADNPSYELVRERFEKIEKKSAERKEQSAHAHYLVQSANESTAHGDWIITMDSVTGTAYYQKVQNKDGTRAYAYT